MSDKNQWPKRILPLSPDEDDALEHAIFALEAEAEHNELWRGRRDYRIEQPKRYAAILYALRARMKEP